MKTYSFEKVYDGSNRRVRGLWRRNGAYYCQTTVIDASTGVKKTTRLPVSGDTVPEAKQAMAVLLATLEETGTVHGKAGPKFSEFREHYGKVAMKAAKTLTNEDHFLKQWERFLGSDTKVTQITAQNVLAYRAELQSRNLSPRTINLHTRALKQLLYLARTEKYLKELPTAGIKQLKEKQGVKELLTNEELQSIISEALKHKRTGEQFADFIKLAMYSGGRVGETLKLKWSNVDFDNEQLVFVGSDTKSGDTRRVDFNANLKSHLLAMQEIKEGDYLFPSFRTDGPITSFKKIMQQIRSKLGLDHFTFHSTRHYFISTCVMKGIDYLTIAKWVGHKDGGVLIGRVYGHLNNAHLKLQASKLTF